MQRAIYAFSGDPITFGHIDVIERAARVFDELVVAIGTNPDKSYTFTLEERVDMAEKSLTNYENVKVVSFNGTLVDYAYENSIPLVIKGIRNGDDFNYEVTLHQIGESQKLGVDTFFIPANQDKMHISSSAVKALQKEHGLVHEYVPLYVKQKLEEKMSNQFIVGITGEIASGKSYVSKKFIEIGKREGVEVHNIELDEVGHKILTELEDPLYVEVRNLVIEEFGDEIVQEDGFIDRKILGKIVFEDKDKLQKLNEITHEPILMRVRREVHGKTGLVILNAALFAEIDIGYLCNNNFILVSTDEDTQKKRMFERGLDEEQIVRRLESQFDTESKRDWLLSKIEESGQGNLWEIRNDGNMEVDETVDGLLDKLTASIE